MSNQEEDKEDVEVPEVPEEWLRLDLHDMVDKGWRPRIKKKADREYLTMRFGNQERSLGPATQERINLFAEMFPRMRAMLTSAMRRPTPTKSSLLTTPIKKPEEVGKGYRPSLEVLNWYSWARSKNFEGNLGDFVNEVVHDYFRNHGWRLAVVKVGN